MNTDERTERSSFYSPYDPTWILGTDARGHLRPYKQIRAMTPVGWQRRQARRARRREIAYSLVTVGVVLLGIGAGALGAFFGYVTWMLVFGH